MNYEEYMDLLKDKITSALEKGVNPWQGPWEVARNGSTGRPYSGANALFLSLASHVNFGGDNRFYTFEQAKKMGCNIKKGEMATPAFYFKSSFIRDKKDEDGNVVLDNEGKPEKEVVNIPPVFKTYYLFNAQQLKPVPPDLAVPEDADNYNEELAETYLESSPVKIEYGHPKAAFYSSAADQVVTFPKSHFERRPQEFYSTVFHEMAHATSAEHRLDRARGNSFEDKAYAKEELIAEITALTLCAKCGMKYANENSAAYIADWYEMLKSDDFSLASLYKEVSMASEYLTNPSERPRLHQSATYGEQGHPTEPVVHILESSNSSMKKGFDMSLMEADLSFSEINKAEKDISIAGEGSDKKTSEVKYYVSYIGNGKLRSYNAVFDTAKENGGLLKSIEDNASRMANDPNLGEAERKSSKYVLEKVVPYMQKHVELSAIKTEARRELKNLNGENSEKKDYCDYLIRYADNYKKKLNSDISFKAQRPKTQEAFQQSRLEKKEKETSRDKNEIKKTSTVRRS